MQMNHEDRCKRIVSAIETLSETEVEELFRMIHRNNYNYTKNNHGVFINLSWIPEHMISLMEKYVEFCHRSKVELQKYESICDVLNHRFQEEREKVNLSSLSHEIKASFITNMKTTNEPPERANKVSTSLRFYLLKKKFAKVSSIANNFENDLKPEEYVICS